MPDLQELQTRLALWGRPHLGQRSCKNDDFATGIGGILLTSIGCRLNGWGGARPAKVMHGMGSDLRKRLRGSQPL
jgi:hypothetical protein